MIWRSLVMCLVFGLMLTGTDVAQAQRSAEERAAAEALFDQALKAMESGQPAEACPKLEESQRLDPGVGTLLYLADCYRTIGRTASSWATFLQAAYAAKAAGQTDRQAIAQEQADALKPTLSKLVVHVPAPAPAGLVVSNDGEAIGTALWNSEIPVDPGEHSISATAEGKRPWTSTVTVPAGPAVTKIDVPVLDDPPPPLVAAAPAVQPTLLPPPTPRETTPVTPPPSRGNSSASTWGWAAVVGGGAALVGGGLFTVLAIADNTRADEHCRKGEPELCGQRGIELGESASSKAQLATILSGVGGALAITGFVLVLTAPSDAEQALLLRSSVGLTSGGLQLSGEF